MRHKKNRLRWGAHRLWSMVKFVQMLFCDRNDSLRIVGQRRNIRLYRNAGLFTVRAEALQAAEKGLERLMDAYNHLMKLKASDVSTVDVKDLRRKCYDAMNDDLNSPIVIAHLFDAARAINSVKDGKATISAEDLKELQDVFHTFVFDILGIKDEAASGGSNNNEAFGKAMDLLLTIRQQAKANKDWATSDKIRNELTAIGFDIKDTKDGAEWKLSK